MFQCCADLVFIAPDARPAARALRRLDVSRWTGVAAHGHGQVVRPVSPDDLRDIQHQSRGPVPYWDVPVLVIGPLLELVHCVPARRVSVRVELDQTTCHTCRRKQICSGISEKEGSCLS